MDGNKTEVKLGAAAMEISPQKHADGWKFDVEVTDLETHKILQKASVITDESGAQISVTDDKAKGESELKAFALALSLAKPNKAANDKTGAIFSQDMVALNFSEPTEVKDLIKTMAKITGKNIILSRDVNAKIQIVSPQPVTKKEAYEAFVRALDIAGLAVADQGKVIRISRKAY